MEKACLMTGKHYKLAEVEVIYQNLAGEFKSEKRWAEDVIIAQKTNNRKLMRDLESYKKRENKIETYFFMSRISSMEDGVEMWKDDDSEYRDEDGILLEPLVYSAHDAFLNAVSSERFVDNFIPLNEDELAWFNEVVSEEASFQLALNDEEVEKDLNRPSLHED